MTILRRNSLALFCSARCPGNLILQTYDLTRALREAEVTAMSGFHRVFFWERMYEWCKPLWPDERTIQKEWRASAKKIQE